MVKIAKLFGYTLFFILALMYFTPKVALYYFAEMQLKPMSVIINDEKVIDNGFSLSIKDSTITFKAIESAKIQTIDLVFFGLYNKVKIEGVTLASTAASLVPTKVQSIELSYHIFNPFNVSAIAVGDFGEAQAQVSILDKALQVDLQPSKLMNKEYRATLKNLKKTKDGGYEYAKNF